VLLATLTAVNAADAGLRALGNPDLRAAMAAGYALMRTAIVVAFACFVIVREPARNPCREPVAFIACAAAIGSIVCLRGPAGSVPAAMALTGELVALCSLLWLLAAVLALGTCFGVLPEARGLVTRGPYRLVRHPVYLGELGACAGLVIASPTVWNLSAAVTFAAAQAVRMRLEERALTRAYPAYAHYAARTPRLLPRPGTLLRGWSAGQPISEFPPAAASLASPTARVE
jgi:protein-S-isoprenylcysteine O-methyltransferase Ste14